MSKDEALKLALEALHGFIPYLPLNDEAQCGHYDEALTAIKEALAQPEHGWTPERIAGMTRLKEAQDKKLAQPEQEYHAVNAVHKGQQCYVKTQTEQDSGIVTAGGFDPRTQRTWVGLTDEEIENLCLSLGAEPIEVRFIEAKLKEKNT